jgi:hypothetical protein
MSEKRNIIKYFAKNLSIVVGLVLIWRGIWYILDFIDNVFFSGSHIFTVVFGIILGLAILYIPDKDLKEISKL